MISASRRLENVFSAGIGDNCNSLFELLRPIMYVIGPLPLPGIDIVLSLMNGLIVIARLTY